MVGRVLLVHHDSGAREALAGALRARGHGIAAAADTGEQALQALGRQPPTSAVIGHGPGAHPDVLCGHIAQRHPQLPLVLVGPDDTVEAAMTAFRAGASDYVPGPLDPRAVAEAIDRIEQTRWLARWLTAPLPRPSRERPLSELIGESQAIRQVRSLLERVRHSASTVLITGESGTGKEVVARALHRHGPRARGPLVAINCAAIPETLLESELFGHEKGAFTDARGARTGLLPQADGGTLFLDEITALSLPLQAKLLRALQERRAAPLGGHEETPFDARIVTATNGDLAAEVRAGRFREDLFFRINVVHVELPPLRTRGEDVLLLARHFVEKLAARMDKHIVGITPGAARRLCAYDWPGNVRELENCIEAAVVRASHDHVTEDDLPERLGPPPPETATREATEDVQLVPLETLECAHLAQVMRQVGGNKSLASRILGVDRKTLYRKLRRYRLEDMADEAGQEAEHAAGGNAPGDDQSASRRRSLR